MTARSLVAFLALLLVGCGRAHVQTGQQGAAVALPRPAHVVVTDFAIDPSEVKLDSGVSAEFMRTASGTPLPDLLKQAAGAAQDALAERLASRLASYGLPVERLPAKMTPPPGSLLVQGQIVSVDEGNRTRRTLVGLGAGKSSVGADAQLYYITDPAQPLFLESFNGTADSGRMPGAAETMGAGAAADRLATSAATTAATHAGGETRRTGEAANAEDLADELAKQIGAYAVKQGWIAASAVH
jgi:hypothetical protein